MSQATSPSSSRPYGLARVCRVWEIPRSSVYAAHAHNHDTPRVVGRRGPKTACSDARLTEEIRAVLDHSPFLGEGHRKVWARLRLAGVRTSKARVLRLMRTAGLLAPTRAGHAHGPKAHDGTIITERPDEAWGTDATS
jgi:hypothetical protein